MKKSIHIAAILFFVGLAPLSAYAVGPTISVDVPSNCTAVDTSGAQHIFPQNDSPSSYLGICMLEAAQEAGLATFTFTNDPSLGLYIQSVNGVNPTATEYWALWDNGVMASCGIGCTPVSQGDTVSLILTDWTTNDESSTVTFQAHSLIAPSSSPLPSGVGDGIQHSELNAAKATAYLAGEQRADGSFGTLLLSDWAALAFAAVDHSDTAKTKLHDYFLTATATFSTVTDYERHAMALEALDIDPYSGSSVDTISPIIRAFDGVQIGDATLDNDDVFALFPLLAAGYEKDDAIIQKIAAFVLSRQGRDGSWDGSVDMTAAAVQALAEVRSLSGVDTALAAAEKYLRSNQQDNGGFGNSFSTSWAMQAMGAFDGSSRWAPTGYFATDYLGDLQQADGSIAPVNADTETRVWATEYAIPAAFGKSWPALLHSFAKQNVTENEAISTTTQLSLTATSSQIDAQHATKSKGKAASSPAIPILTDTQTAAVANAPANDIFAHLWNAITGFFKSWL